MIGGGSVMAIQRSSSFTINYDIISFWWDNATEGDCYG